jgi:hypothetical protein
MTQPLVDRLADAVLYEGYILYPYRPSVKNRQRWTFGGLVPLAYAQAHPGSDTWSMQTECLIHDTDQAAVEVRVRFLHLLERITPGESGPAWQEAVERVVVVPRLMLAELVDEPRRAAFAFSGEEVGAGVVRRQQTVEGTVEISAQRVREEGFRLTVRVVNLTPLDAADGVGRDEAMLRGFAATHAILSVRGGQFLSLIDPPEAWRDAAATCRNVGTWPVLVGEEGQTDTVLSAPIILYDYPQIAPESPGDFFVRRHGDRRDADAAHLDADGGRETADGQHRRPGTPPAGANRGAGSRTAIRLARDRSRTAAGAGGGTP